MFRRTRTVANRPSNRLNLFGRRSRFNLLNLESRIAPATITVTNNTDLVAAADGVSIREALDSFNAGANTSDVVADITNPYGTLDTLLFSGVTSPITLASGQLSYTKAAVALTITGPGSSLLSVMNTAANSATSRVLNITGGNVSITGLTLTGGNSSDTGAGINFTTQTVTLNDVTITGNVTTAGVDGGGIRFSTGVLNLTGSTISNNTADSLSASAQGGAIYMSSAGTMNITDSTLSGNTAGADGGGIYTFSGGTTTILSSTVSGNVGNVTGVSLNYGGGGVSIFSGTFTMANSTVSGNTSTLGSGGGVLLYGVIDNIRNSTIAFNDAPAGNGGGIYIYGYGAKLNGLSSTIVSNNTNSGTTSPDVFGTIDVSNQSLIQDPTGSTITTGSAVNANPGLGSFGLNGGTTKNFVPASAGPADGAGNNDFIINTAQNNATRPASGSGPDIGSTETAPTGTPAGNATGPTITIQTPAVEIITVTYSIGIGLLLGSSVDGTGDITVTGPGGYSQPGTLTNGPFANAASIVATYSVPANAGGLSATDWDSSDNGSYTVTLNALQIYDSTNTNAAPAGAIGTFKVAVPIVYTVDIIEDEDDGSLVSVPGDNSLREVIRLANDDGVPSSINFSALFNSAQTIYLGPTGVPPGLGLEMAISKDVTINAPGAQLTIDAEGLSRIFTTSAVVSMANMKIINGNTVGNGGGILVASGSLTMANVVLDNNTASGTGGGISFGAATVTMNNCTVSDNVATGNGGGVEFSSGTLVDPGTTISGNNSGNHGGGIYAGTGFTMTITDTTVSGNTSVSDGAGIYTFGAGTTTIISSTIDSNVSNSVAPGGNGGGCGLSLFGGTVTISNSTVANNTATAAPGGGARFAGGIVANVRNCTFAFNQGTTGGGISTTSTVNLDSTIVSDSTGGDTGGTIAVSNQSLIEDGLGVITLGSAVSGDPGFGVFATAFGLHGGTTKNLLPASGGPADGAGNNDFIINTAQNNVTRPASGSGPDIGSTELLPTGIPAGIATGPTITVQTAAVEIITVTYTIGIGLLLGSSVDGTGDITVTGPGGYSQPGTLTNGPFANAAMIVATYSVPANTAGSSATDWDGGDNGSYTVTLNALQIYDSTNTNAAPAGAIGSFKVAVPIVYTVDIISDEDDGSLVSVPTDNSLRECIRLANTDGVPSVIEFDALIFTGTQTIDLTGFGSELSITAGVTINGPTGGVILDAKGAARVLQVNAAAAAVSISKMTMTGGNSGVGFHGGGVMLTAGTLTMTNCLVDANTADLTGGGFRVNSGAALVLNNSTVSNNTVPAGAGFDVGDAGGISGAGGTPSVTLNNSTVSGNTANDDAGGIYFYTGGSLIMNNSTVSGNVCNLDDGGGMYLWTPTVTIINSTISGNQSGDKGGGIAMQSATTVNIRNSTVAFNTATGTGGGIEHAFGTLNIDATIVSNNTAASGTEINGTVTANFSLIGDAAGDSTGATITGASNQIDLDPLLGVLANNGGPTKTHAITSAGAAFNTGSDILVLGTDQRGGAFGRVEFGQADIGAFEVQAVTVTSIKVNNVTGGQRSNVFSMVITFSESVTFSGAVVNAFTVARKNAPPSQTEQPGLNGLVNIAATPLAGPASVVTLTFLTAGANPIFGVANLGGASFPFNSLPDGTYDLNIDAGQITGSEGGLDGNTAIAGSEDFDQVGSTNTVNDPYGLFRLFGDITGDGSVAVNDFNQFKGAFSNGPNAAFDYDNDGDVAIIDFNEFKKRNGSSLP